jgi:hypothetical protein
MVTKSKIALIAAVLGLLSASPALAQSFDNDFGTGNELPSHYHSQGGLHTGIAAVQHNQTGVRRSGLKASVGRSGW